MDSAIAGLIGALVGAAAVLIGQILSNRHQRQLAEQAWGRRYKLKHYERLQSLYVATIASFERCIRTTEEMRDYADVTGELPRLNARLRLVAPKQLVDQAQVASQALYHWSSEFRAGAPKQVGGTSVAVVSSTGFPHHEKARSLYPAVNAAIDKMAELMEAHLRTMQPLAELNYYVARQNT